MRSLILRAISFAALCLLSSTACAQHSIEVERHAQAGEWMASLSAYKKMPTRKVTATTALAAAKSAWALGLVEMAKAEYDRALVLNKSENSLSDNSRARVLFARGIIELQEGNYQKAIAFGEKSAILVDPSPLRGEIDQLLGEALLKLNKPEQAIRKFELSLENISDENSGDLRYAIASAAMNIGELEKAEEHLSKIPVKHKKSGLAVKALASIAMEKRDYRAANFWLKKGRSNYSDLFLDSWVDFALVKSFASLGQLSQAEQIVKKANEKYPPSDGWVILMQSTIEQARWESSESKMARMVPQSNAQEAHGK